MGLISIGIFALLALVSILLVFNDRTKLNDLSQKKEYLGKFHGGTFYSQPLLPLDEDTEETLNAIIREHNKKIGVFYLSFIFLIAGIILFNIGD